MNRTATILIVTAVIAAVAGWAAARTRAHIRERNEARREAAAIEERATRPAKEISALIAQADEVVLNYGRDIDNKKIRLTDAIWIKRLASTTGSAQYEATGRGAGLGIVFPIIEIRRAQKGILSLMVWSRTLDVMGNSSIGGNFVVGEEATDAIRRLIAEAETAHPGIAPPMNTKTADRR